MLWFDNDQMLRLSAYFLEKLLLAKITRLSKSAADLGLKRHQAFAGKFLGQISPRQVWKSPVATIKA